MKISVNQLNPQGNPIGAVLEHQGQGLQWNIRLVDRTTYNGTFDIFEQINGYWAYLAPEKQSQIFAVYRRIWEVFQTTEGQQDLTRLLYPLVRELYLYHDLVDLRHWIDYHSDIMIPHDPNLKDEYVESHETQYTRVRTYLKEDYRWVIAMCLSFRAMIPVWGEFIAKVQDEVGTNFKEYYAFQLLAYTNIEHSEPMERLRRFVEESLPADKSKAAAIYGNLGSEDFPTWMLALVCVRRLSVSDIRGTVPGSSLVKNIFTYIGPKTRGHDSNFIGRVNDKIIEGQGQDNENNLSRLEGYKIKQEISTGDTGTIIFVAQDTRKLARQICPDFNMELLDISEESIKPLEQVEIPKPQTLLAQMVLARKVSPEGLLNLHRTGIVRVLALTQALLWHRQHYELAALVSAIEQSNKNEFQLDDMGHRQRISKEQLDKLDELYPYQIRPAGKGRTSKRTNDAVENIDVLADLFSAHSWRLTLPPDWIGQFLGNKMVRRYSVPPDIKVKLANLAIALGSRSF